MAYHVLIDGEQQGPFEVPQLAAMIGRGEVTAETLVWSPDMTDWAPAREVAELASHLGDTASAGRGAAPLGDDGTPALRLDVGQAFSSGFGAVFREPVGVLVMMLVYFVIATLAILPYFGVTMLGMVPTADGGATGGFVVAILLTYLFSLAVNSALYGGLTYSMLCSLRHEPFGVGTLLAGFTRILPLLIFFILYTIAVTIGLVLLVIPGIFLAVAFALTPLLIMDRRAGPIAGMRGSLKAVMGVGWWRTFAVMLIVVVCFLVIVMVLIFGLGAGAVMLAASGGGDPAAGASAAAVVGILLVQMAFGAAFAVVFSAILASIYEQARPALDTIAES